MEFLEVLFAVTSIYLVIANALAAAVVTVAGEHATGFFLYLIGLVASLGWVYWEVMERKL